MKIRNALSSRSQKTFEFKIISGSNTNDIDNFCKLHVRWRKFIWLFLYFLIYNIKNQEWSSHCTLRYIKIS
jgi:hypothetical protein